MHEVTLLLVLRIGGTLLVLVAGLLWLLMQPGSAKRSSIGGVSLAGIAVQFSTLALVWGNVFAVLVQGAQLIFFLAMLTVSSRSKNKS